MFLVRTKELIEGGGQLLRAEAELATQRFKRAVVSSALLLAVMLVACIGLAMAIAGGTVALAQTVGVPIALACVGGSLAMLGGVAFLVIYAGPGQTKAPLAEMRGVEKQNLQPKLAPVSRQASDTTSGPGSTLPPPVKPERRPGQEVEPKEKIMQAKEQMQDAVDPSHDPGGTDQAHGRTQGGSGVDLAAAAIDFVSKNPVAVGSAAFIALSIIGPGRAFRLVSRGAAAAGMIATVAEKLRDTDREKGSEAKAAPGPAVR